MSLDSLFPLSMRVNADDHLEIGGCDTTHLAEEYGTPLYLFDEITLREQARQARDALAFRRPGSLVLYAAKAYLAPFLARLYNDLGLGLDVTSEGELEIARRVNFPSGRIYLHGNNKTTAELRAALELGVEHVVADNRTEIPLIAAVARELGRTPRLLLRLSPHVDPHTHRYLVTGHAESKFGLGITGGEAARACKEIAGYPNLSLVGLHIHLGSQFFDMDALVRGLRGALNVARDWKTQFGFELEELDMGGGWGIGYTADQEALDVEAIAETLCAGLRAGLEERGLSPHCRLRVEPGRALVGRAGVALYRVGTIKRVSVSRTFASVDGGMGDNIRPALYGARYTAAVANRFSALPQHTYSIAGRYCEQGDIMVEAVSLPVLEPGDLLAVPSSGAYQLPMSSNYNLIPRPAVVLLKDGAARLVRRRETVNDLLACDVD